MWLDLNVLHAIASMLAFALVALGVLAIDTHLEIKRQEKRRKRLKGRDDK